MKTKKDPIFEKHKWTLKRFNKDWDRWATLKNAGTAIRREINKSLKSAIAETKKETLKEVEALIDKYSETFFDPKVYVKVLEHRRECGRLNKFQQCLDCFGGGLTKYRKGIMQEFKKQLKELSVSLEKKPLGKKEE